MSSAPEDSNPEYGIPEYAACMHCQQMYRLRDAKEHYDVCKGKKHLNRRKQFVVCPNCPQQHNIADALAHAHVCPGPPVLRLKSLFGPADADCGPEAARAEAVSAAGATGVGEPAEEQKPTYASLDLERDGLQYVGTAFRWPDVRTDPEEQEPQTGPRRTPKRRRREKMYYRKPPRFDTPSLDRSISVGPQETREATP